jgi:hypothetical protein
VLPIICGGLPAQGRGPLVQWVVGWGAGHRNTAVFGWQLLVIVISPH